MFKRTGYNRKNFLTNWLVVFAVLLLGASTAFGYNSLRGDVDVFGGLSTIGEMFGGLSSLGALVGALVALAIIAGGLVYMGKANYTGKSGKFIFHVVLGVAVVAVAAFVGFNWFVWPNDGWTSLGLGLGALLAVTGATALVTNRTKSTLVRATPN